MSGLQSRDTMYASVCVGDLNAVPPPVMQVLPQSGAENSHKYTLTALTADEVVIVVNFLIFVATTHVKSWLKEDIYGRITNNHNNSQMYAKKLSLLWDHHFWSITFSYELHTTIHW